MSTKEGDHGRATFLLRTGYLPRRGRSSTRRSARSSPRSSSDDDAELPGFVSIAPNRLLSPGAFGPASWGRSMPR